jgi:hypothetical protein
MVIFWITPRVAISILGISILGIAVLALAVGVT